MINPEADRNLENRSDNRLSRPLVAKIKEQKDLLIPLGICVSLPAGFFILGNLTHDQQMINFIPRILAAELASLLLAIPAAVLTSRHYNHR